MAPHAASGAAGSAGPKFTSQSGPASQWTGARGGPACLACSASGLIYVGNGAILDMDATRPVRQAGAGSVRSMIDRTGGTFGIVPQRLTAGTAHGPWPRDTPLFTPHGRHLVAGEWVASAQTFASDPAHGPAHAFSAGTVELVDRACEAAEDAFWSYGYASRDQRAAFLEAIAGEIEARAAQITEIGCQETGLPAGGHRAKPGGRPPPPPRGAHAGSVNPEGIGQTGRCLARCFRRQVRGCPAWPGPSGRLAHAAAAPSPAGATCHRSPR